MNFEKIINESNKHTVCVNACHSVRVSTQGFASMCCISDPKFFDMAHLLVSEKNLEDIQNHISFREVRAALARGEQHSACSHCWVEESVGKRSKRLRDNERYLKALKNGEESFQGIAKLDLSLSNVCNLGCRTCGPTSSSQLIEESYDLYAKHLYPRDKFIQYFRDLKTPFNDDSIFWGNLEKAGETLRQIDFFGGEPFLSKKMWTTLEKFVELGRSQYIELDYNTNGTTWPEKVEIWSKFKKVNISFSIDGIGEQFEFMRNPASWDEVSRNMKKAREFCKDNPHVNLNWCVTVSSLNVYNLPEILEEHQKNYSDFNLFINFVHTPIEYNCSSLPLKVKERILEKYKYKPFEKLKQVISFIKNDHYTDEIWKSFLNKVKLQDEYRNQNFYNTFQEYGKIIKDNE